MFAATDCGHQDKEGGFMILKLVLGAVAGGIVGYGLYRIVGCASGACPLTSNPWISAVYGMVMGVLLAMSVK